MSLYPLSVPPLVTYVLRQDINDDHNFCIFILVHFKNTFHSLILSRFPYRQWYNRVSSSEQIPWKQFYYFLAFEFLCHYCWVIKSHFLFFQPLITSSFWSLRRRNRKKNWIPWERKSWHWRSWRREYFFIRQFVCAQSLQEMKPFVYHMFIILKQVNERF